MANNLGSQRGDQEPSYDEMKPTYTTNMDKLEGLFYAAQARKDHGIEGQRNAVHTAMWGLRNKIGIEGILSSLEADAMQSVEDQNGVNANLDLAENITSGAQTFIGSAFKLKISDLMPYIRERLDGVDIAEKYEDKTIESCLPGEDSIERGCKGNYCLV